MYNVIIKYDTKLDPINVKYASIRELRRAITLLLEEKSDGTRVSQPMTAELAIRIHDK